ncbi:PorT family protein [Paludibacter sp. 221]|uniref:porin family protein n=1 Tax=Paludibacter sp. 221 TaxID=2302939 RepID=UPI0013D0DEBB|nr:porin family protein [Paludibacter sp. 221]NDV46658.1 PorT family protein [Paludibacter sp. 221]
MKIKLFHILLLACVFFILPITAQSSDENPTKSWEDIDDQTHGIIRSFLVGVEYRVKAGIAIGGTAPLPIPLEIREVKGFNPLINTSVEAEIVKTFNEPFGLSFGLRLETKGMKTNASVKNYSMKITEGNSEISGVWTGMVETQVSNSYLTIPILFVWKPSKRWEIKLGPYGSYALTRNFTGQVYDGYLRVGSPIGEKIELNRAIYDFSADLSHWDCGLQLGTDFRAFPHLMAGIDLTWGVKSIFKKGFETITFDMYPIFIRLNFGYAF